MARQKIDGVILGKGASNSNATSSQMFSSTAQMGAWSNSLSYPADAMVEYSGKYYRSLHGTNLNNQPDTSTADWELYSPLVHDGDVAIVLAGILSDVQVRNNGAWISLAGIPLLTVLNDNSSGQIFLAMLLSVAKSATIEYTIDRGSNSRRGTLRYMSDGTPGVAGVSLSDTNNVDIGAGDVGVTFGAQVNSPGTIAQILADVDSQSGIPAIVKYVVKGWV